MDDGSGVLLPYMTQIRTDLRDNAFAGVEAVQGIEAYAHDFAQQLNAKMNGVDMSLPENQPFKAAVKALQDEFSEYMRKVPFSNPSALQALGSQISQFDSMLEKLPQPVRKSKVRKTAYSSRKVSEKAQEAVPPPPLDGGPRPQIAAY